MSNEEREGSRIEKGNMVAFNTLKQSPTKSSVLEFYYDEGMVTRGSPVSMMPQSQFWVRVFLSNSSMLSTREESSLGSDWNEM